MGDEPCSSLAELAQHPPADVLAADWQAAISQVERRLQAVDTRYDRLDLRIYRGTAHAKDNYPYPPAWPSNEFKVDAIALLEHLVPGDGDITRDVWVLRVFDVVDRLYIELQQLPDEPSTTYASNVSSFGGGGTMTAACTDCFPQLSEFHGTSAPIMAEATFTGSWATGAKQVVDVQLDLVAVDEAEVGLLPVWLSNFYTTDKRGDEISYAQSDFVDGEIVLPGGLLSESHPVPAGVNYDACARSVAYSATAYISEDCPERYGARDFQLHAPKLCCWHECYDCPERFCLDPDKYDF
ncbi:hypothetical protein [Polyangium mundeleinium]|uniref:Uncharacterized protein n=1 Tax=Polyangium mundeleinium TaxID=2995306 RepID=A0ABT5F4L3_9BACT|nr:hypothetical protein [Polyangium mundeleinium]MDC0748016.1 hypothetical protein [Polyangium mundeleinium]